MRLHRIRICLFFLVYCVSVFPVPLRAENRPPRNFKGDDIAGEAFGRAVTKEDFLYQYKTAVLFSRTGAKERTEQDIRSEAWRNLVLLHAAREEGINAGREEVEKELKRLLSEKGIEYGGTDYGMWVMTELKDDVEMFERRIKDLLTINKLIRVKTDPEVDVTDEEIKQKFLDQHNFFESEYIRFDNEKEAGAFLRKVRKRPRLWKKTFDAGKSGGRKEAAHINEMSLEALIDLWKIPREDAYAILAMEPEGFTTAGFYYGAAVFRLIGKKEASLEEYTDEKKESYRNMMINGRKRELSRDYFDDLFSRAGYRDYMREEEHARKADDMKKKSHIALETTEGIIKLRLFPDTAPLACENFTGLVERGYYDGLVFHRVIKDFMIQGGDPTGTGTGGDSIWGRPFADETDEGVVFDRPYLLAMANSGANTNGSQFFITVKPAPWLNGKHTIFGEVVDGFEAVKAIESSPVDSKDRPEEDRKITKAYIMTGEQG